MSGNKNIILPPETGQSELSETNIASPSSDASSVTGIVQTSKTQTKVSSSAERQIKFERAQKCLENAALVSKRIKEHRKATAELLGKPFDDDDDGNDTTSEMASTMSEKTGYSAATDTSTTLSVQEALNIPGISESLANTLKQKELLMERIKQYKEISKRPMNTASRQVIRRDSISEKGANVNKGAGNSDVTQLIGTIKDKENALSVMQVKMKAMETTILDLQEKISEKDQIIEAKNKATTIISDSLSKKERDTLALLEDTRQQMMKMQENFASMEAEWKDERQKLIQQLDSKEEKISNLEEANTILENVNSEVTKEHRKLAEDIEIKNKEILELQEQVKKLCELQHANPDSENKQEEAPEKGTQEIAAMEELTKKIELLEQLNCQIRQTNIELENKLATINTETKSSTSMSPSKKGTSPVPTRKGGRNTASKMKSPWSNLSTESLQEVEKKPNKSESAKHEMLVQSLNKDILEKEYIISQNTSIISDLKKLIDEKEETIKTLISKEIVPPVPSIDTLDAGVNTEIETKPLEDFSIDSELPNNVETLQEKLKSALEQIAALNSEIEASNKNMIKIKSTHKLKLKQLQKTIDNFSKVSDSNAEIIKLNEEIHNLSQKVAELEEEKGNLQLHLVDYDSGRFTDTDIYKRMVEMENLAESRLKAISVLETQKFDLVQELHVLQQKNYEMEDKLADLTQLQSDQVCSEIKSVQLEEQIDHLIESKKELEHTINELNNEKLQLNEIIKSLEEEKDDILQKLNNCIQENIELADKIEKMSAEKVSSAESIEIVESLTTQEKLELEEYNKGMIDHKIVDQQEEYPTHDNMENIVEQSEELNKKIELFTQERQEVLEKMNMISEDNKALQIKISELSQECDVLRNNIELVNKEKQELQMLNEDITKQVEELKRERIDIMKESVEIPKPSSLEDAGEAVAAELQQEEKSTADKGNNRAKSVKQLTKEILKLKNTIKEREAEIADCQMKILSLEEHQQKQNELLRTNASYESKVKALIEENAQIRQEIDSLRHSETALTDAKHAHDLFELKQDNELMQQNIQKIHQEYTAAINTRDAKIYELENLLKEYESQIMNYGNTLKQKDKEISEYINQVTKLNDVSQKLRSTIELLEEEKIKDQNAELVKSLNKQVMAYQKKLSEYEEKIHAYEEEKAQLLSIKNTLEAKQSDIETELTKMQELVTERQNTIKELQSVHQKQAEDMKVVLIQVKERDEEIHEVKLQLRKESIENEKLRNSLSEKETRNDELTKQVQDLLANLTEKSCSSDEINQEITELKSMLNTAVTEKNEIFEKYETLENKQKDLLEKLKKFAANYKKKSAMNTELENLYHESQKQLELRNEQIEQLTIQVETLPALQEKLKYAEEELNSIRAQKIIIEQQKVSEITALHQQIEFLQNEFSRSNGELNLIRKEVQLANEDNARLKKLVDGLDKMLAEQEIEQKNNINLSTKLSTLEADVNNKQQYIMELQNLLESYQQQLNQVQFGHDAKVQERELYIENLETEIDKYKHRINRLEESVSLMENRRNSLERQADQLDTQLQEKQKAYSEYTSQEDELVSRLAVLIDHDRLVHRQLHEIESENKELHYKIQHLNDENQRYSNQLAELQSKCNNLLDKANRVDAAESELSRLQSQVKELDSQIKRITQEHQSLLTEKRREIEEIESEFTIQIENALKEKKMLSEKYEKVKDHIQQLEEKLQEYRTNIDNLNLNIMEVNRINQELRSQQSNNQVQTPDYTEQYINEINKLNATINSKVTEINDLNVNIQKLQTNNNVAEAKFKQEISEYESKCQAYTNELSNLKQHIEAIESENSKLVENILSKEDQIKQISQKKTLMFEMNIPKTEGMFISSMIEPVEEIKNLDIAGLESQIVSDIPQPEIISSDFVAESFQTQANTPNEAIVEQVIVPKKAYQCFKGDQEEKEIDPFNSDEGWGLGEAEESSVVMPGYTEFNAQIEKLKLENETLKANLKASGLKLQKALRKLKELKANNDVLTNELNISKQVSQTSSLDFAIEDELTKNIQELEKKVIDITTELNKEKREKDALRKQNEVFNNANDKLTEMKEKLDNEIELWKYKFKEANDKLSSYQWGASADTPQHKPSHASTPSGNTDQIREEIIKLEKENEELHTLNESLSNKYEDVLKHQTELKNINNDLQNKLEDSQDHSEIKSKLSELISENQDLQRNNDALLKQISEKEAMLQESELVRNNAQNNFETAILLKDKQIEELTMGITDLENLKSQALNNVSVLTQELENAKSELLSMEQANTDKNTAELNMLTEKTRILEEQCEMLNAQLEQSEEKLFKLSGIASENQELIDKLKFSEQEINKLKTDLMNLHSELNKPVQVFDQGTDENQVQLKHLEEQIAKLRLENKQLLEKVEQEEATILELNGKLNQLNSENDNLLSTVTELRSSLTSAVDQRGFEIAELWKQHLAQREADFLKSEQELRAELSLSESKYEQLLDSVQSSTQEETNKLIIMEQLSSQQSKLQDREDQIHALQDKYSEVLSQLEMLRSELDDEKILCENKLVAQQEEYDKVIKDLSKTSESYTETNQQYEKLQSELTAVQSENEDLHRQIEDLVMTIKDSEEKILELNNEIRFKDAEIHRKTHEYTMALSQREEEFENVRRQLLDYEKKIEDLSFEKESELAVLRLKMHEERENLEKQCKELNKENESLAEALNAKIIECTNLNRQIVELNKSLEEDAARCDEMQTALETQELEIVTLKDEIAGLQEMMRMSSSRIEKHVTFTSDTKPGSDVENEEMLNKELLDAVPRAELDLALYMLHQRDVRCEELTMELTQLLEERDTLQLRLSDSLRSYEDLRSKCVASGLDSSLDTSQETISELPSFSVEKEFVDTHRGNTSRSSSISDADPEKPKLQAKLSEIRAVRQNRDITLRQESESRQLGLRLLQRDVANLPPEAVERLSQAHHTFSRDSQSTSTVLLNWLRGKSTPKVVHM